jgi:hypothetical protein
MPYAMPTAQGIWVWDDPPSHTPNTPVVLAGVAGVADLAHWAARHHLPVPLRRDHPDVPALGLAQRGPVWLGTLPGGPWVAWTPEGTWALPTTWPDWPQALAGVRDAGRPWHLWTPRSVWEARSAPIAAIDPHQPWYLGQTPTGAVFAWQAGSPPRFVRAGSAPDAPPYEWPALRPAAQFVTGHGLVLRGFCPRAIARRLIRTRAVSRVDLTL